MNRNICQWHNSACDEKIGVYYFCTVLQLSELYIVFDIKNKMEIKYLICIMKNCIFLRHINDNDL